MHALSILVALALAATAHASPSEVRDLQSVEPVDAAADGFDTDALGCYQQGTPSRPAMCYKPNCPSDKRSVFWDFGCPDGSWKCCI